MTELSRFKQAEMVWCQEEPRNMGAWFFVDTFLEWVLNQIGAKHRRPRYAGRPAIGVDRDRPDVEASGAAQGVPRRGAGLRCSVMPGLVPGIHVFGAACSKTWMAGTSPAMTTKVKDVMTEIRVPTLGESVTEATIGKWFKKPGDAVAVDEPLVELETDKVTIEVPAPAAGALGEIAAKNGETVAVGALLGQIKDGAGARREARRREAAPPSRADVKQPKPAAAAPAAPPKVAASRRAARRHRCASSPPRPASTPRRSTAPARTAASPRATCWRRSNAPPRADAGVAARRRRADARALAGRRRLARRAREDDAAAPDHRAPPEGCAEHRRDAHDLQRGRHEPR